jgi:hypothetical protein
MKLLYYPLLLWHILNFTDGSGAFIMPKFNNNNIYKPRQLLSMQLSQKNIYQNKTNSSKVFKIDFTEEERFFTPRYRFGLSEFDIILLRIYVYMVVTIYCTTIIFENIKK